MLLSVGLKRLMGSGGGLFYKLKKYYQYVITGKANEIYERDGKWWYPNFGTGLVPVDLQITDTQIATFDGDSYLQAEIGSLAGLSIVDYIGSCIISLDLVNDRILFTKGNAIYLRLSNGLEIWFKESNGEFIYTTNGANPSLIIIQNVLNSIPVKIDDDYVFTDKSNNNNKVKITNTGCIKFDGTPKKIICDYLTGGDSYYIKSINYGFDTVNDNRILIHSSGGSSDSAKGILIMILRISGTTYLRVWFSNGTTRALNTIVLTTEIQEDNEVEFIWDGITGNAATVLLNGNTINIPNTLSWVGNSDTKSYIGGSVDFTNLLYYKLVSESYTTEQVFQETNETICYDISGNDNNVSLDDIILRSTTDYIPYALALGCTIYQRQSNDKYIVICYNKTESIVDFDRIGYFPPGSGVLIALGYLYTWPDNEQLKEILTIEGLYDMNGEAIPVPFETIKAITPSQSIIKQETVNTVNLMEVKL
jgi:hypothetical protein